MHGRLLMDAAPIAGVPIGVVRGPGPTGCPDVRIDAVSDPDGDFVVPGTHEWSLAVPGDRVVDWGLCVKWRDEWVRLYTERKLDQASPVASIRCDLAALSPPRNEPEACAMECARPDGCSR